MYRQWTRALPREGFECIYNGKEAKVGHGGGVSIYIYIYICLFIYVYSFIYLMYLCICILVHGPYFTVSGSAAFGLRVWGLELL